MCIYIYICIPVVNTGLNALSAPNDVEIFPSSTVPLTAVSGSWLTAPLLGMSRFGPLQASKAWSGQNRGDRQPEQKDS